MGKQINVAAIDVGSHDTFMKIAQLKTGAAPKIIEEVQRTIPIGSDTFTTGEISQLLLNQTIDVLQSFMQKLEEYQVTTLRAVATSAFREARNQLYAIEQIRRQTGVEVEVLSNGKDLFYHQLALSETIPDFEQMISTNALVLNIGSGSIALTLFNEGKYISTHNFRLGSLRIRELLGELERHSTDFNALMAEYISGVLNYYRMFGPKRSDYQNLIVLGGSSRYIQHIAGWGAKNQSPIEVEEFSRFFNKLKQGYGFLGSGKKLKIPTEQENLLGPACIVIDEILQFTGVNQFTLSDLDLADGLLYEMAVNEQGYRYKRNPSENTIEAASSLANRFRTDKKHTRHVQDLALRLYDLTTKKHELPKKAREYLQIAAILHNVGKYISLENDGLLGYKILVSNELIGLDSHETEMIGLIACFHNGHLNPGEPMLQGLSDENKMVVLKLIAILALANSLDAGHKQKIEIIKTRRNENFLEIIIQANQDHTLESWNFSRHTELFEKIFGVKPVLKLQGPKTL